MEYIITSGSIFRDASRRCEAEDCKRGLTDTHPDTITALPAPVFQASGHGVLPRLKPLSNQARPVTRHNGIPTTQSISLGLDRPACPVLSRLVPAKGHGKRPLSTHTADASHMPLAALSLSSRPISRVPASSRLPSILPAAIRSRISPKRLKKGQRNNMAGCAEHLRLTL